MNPDMLFLAERLVSAMETISQDVKNISAYVYDLSYNVSLFLNDKNKTDDMSGQQCNECGSLPRDPPPFAEGEYSLECEQISGSSVPCTDNMQHQEMSVCDVGTINHVHGENTEALALFTGGLKIEKLPEREANNQSCDMEKPFVHARNNERDFTDDIKDEIDISEDFFPLQEAADVPVIVEAPDLEDFPSETTRYPEVKDSMSKTQKMESACGLKNHCMHNNFEETDTANGKLLRGCMNDGGKPPQESLRDTGASFSCFEEKLREHDEKEKEVQRKRCIGAGESRYRAEKKEKASARKSISEQNGRQGRNRGHLGCDTCGKDFRDVCTLEIHKRTHTGEKPFHCAICNKTCTTKGNLASHMKVHSQEKPYICSVCEKSFKRQNDLVGHIRLHRGEKSFVCNVCGKAFTRSTYLTIHMRSHTAEKPFICRECGKAFTQSNNLKCHMRLHSGEKPFICRECGKAFTQNTHLHTHMRTHTGERPFSCKDCGSSFIQSINLKRHRRAVHGVASPLS